MRIVAGKYKGRRLSVPAGREVRPSSDRLREALFNRLAHGGFGANGASILTGAAVLDGFCGTGALGLEALSRGARHVTFIDKDPQSLACARANADALEASESCRFLRADLQTPSSADAPCTLILLDPPYAADLIAPTLTALAGKGWLAEATLIAVEHAANDKPIDPPNGFERLDTRAHGRGAITLLRYSGA